MKKRTQNMKVEVGFIFITKVNHVLIITDVFKNGKCYADEFSRTGIEGVEYEYDEEDILIDKEYISKIEEKAFIDGAHLTGRIAEEEIAELKKKKDIKNIN
ncbi:MAG TPA: hypothetical protein ENH46_04715 [Candidatus Pacearchaeota archaeon]|nr:hypothetical protein [Candidatus Pacearchaeota archaeon]